MRKNEKTKGTFPRCVQISIIKSYSIYLLVTHFFPVLLQQNNSKNLYFIILLCSHFQRECENIYDFHFTNLKNGFFAYPCSVSFRYLDCICLVCTCGIYGVSLRFCFIWALFFENDLFYFTFFENKSNFTLQTLSFYEIFVS